MICRELIELLEKKYPPSIAESWDNPGLQVGSYEKDGIHEGCPLNS